MEIKLSYYRSADEPLKATAEVRLTIPDEKKECAYLGDELSQSLKEHAHAAELARKASDELSRKLAAFPEGSGFKDNRLASSTPGGVVLECNGNQEIIATYLNEADVTHFMLGACLALDRNIFNDANITIDYRGDSYTDISGITLCRFATSDCNDAVGAYVYTFVARKNGGELAGFFLARKIMWDNADDSMVELSRGSDEKKKQCTLLETPSFGIVEITCGRYYAGMARHDILNENQPVMLQTDGRIFRYGETDYPYLNGFVPGFLPARNNCYDIDAVNAVHLFFEGGSESFTYSVLLNGKLYPKLTKTADTVIFHNTPADFQNPENPEVPEQSKHDREHDIVFKKNENGQYMLETYCRNSFCRNAYKAVNSVIELPPFEEKDLNDEYALKEFYSKCVEALYKAICNSEKLFTTFGQWWGGGVASASEYEEITKRLGSDNPPENQIVFKHVGEDKYTVDYCGVTIKVSVSVKENDRENMLGGVFKPGYFVGFPKLSIDNVTFTEPDGSVTIPPQRNFASFHNTVKPIQITAAGDEKSVEITIDQMKNDLHFDSSDIPLNLLLSPDWEGFFTGTNKIGLENYIMVKDAIVKNGIKRCRLLFDENADPLEKMTQLLSDKKIVLDKTIICKVVEIQAHYERTKTIPHLAIVGQAGTGKTTLAKNLGKIFNKDVLALTPSDIKGAYVGHTKYEVVTKLAEAAEKNMIFYLDEAYQLMDDVFGREAVTILLPLMTGDRTKVDAVKDKEKIEIDFDKGTIIYNDDKDNPIKFPPGVIPIWLSGYENEIRLMINKNQGLYRRLDRVVIKTPVTSELLEQFKMKLDEFAGDKNEATKNKALTLQNYFYGEDSENNLEPVKALFVWGTQPQTSKYFANYAGVERFLDNCLDSIRFDRKIGPQVEDIINSTKRDIKRQLAAVGNDKQSESSDANDFINVITDIDTRFSDLVGCKSQIAYMKSIIKMLVNKSVYDDCKLSVPKGALMKGLPGVGKTFIARAMAGELQESFGKYAPDKRFGFMAFSGSELGNKPVSYISSIFSTAEEYDACIMFIDEVDAIAKNRSENIFCSHFLELIKQMDGIEKSSNVFILAATNAPESLDPAFVRSGRIDKELGFELPEKDDRRELANRAIHRRIKTLISYTPSEQHDTEIGLIADMAAKKTPGCTAGDIDAAVNAAFITYHQYYNSDSADKKEFIENYKKFITDDGIEFSANVKGINEPALKELYMFIEEEIERKLAGIPNYKKREAKFSVEKNEGCSAVAVHEVGHAVVSLLLGEGVFDSITTIPRGETLGYVSHSELKLVTKTDYINRICVCMGGRIAEELFWGSDNISAGAVSDMRQATRLARCMTDAWGFSDEFGFMALSEPMSGYLGGGSNYTCSEAFREKSDNAVNELLKKLYSDTRGMLRDKKEIIEKLANKVFDYETMRGEEFETLYKAEAGI